MKIAILGWGPLVWDQRDLRLEEGWHSDGPLLPIEFVPVRPAAADEAQWTPVLCADPWVANVRTLWAQSASDKLDDACDDLAAREDIVGDALIQTQIGYIKREGQNPLRIAQLGDQTDAVRARIRQWLDAHAEYGAVIWRDSRVNWEGVMGPPAVARAIVDHLSALPPDDPCAIAARAYFLNAPVQLWTAVRARILVVKGWVEEPIPWIQSADDLRFKEWQECRTTAGRLDTILVDLRKLGFSLITGLLTAAGFLGFLGVASGPATSTATTAPTATTSAAATATAAAAGAGAAAGGSGGSVSAAVFISIMTLIVALFSVDNYYQTLLSGAIERAMDLETLTDPPLRITKYLSVNSERSRSSRPLVSILGSSSSRPHSECWGS